LFLKPLLFLSLIIILSSCQPKVESTDESGTTDVCTAMGFTEGTEIALCSTHYDYPAGATVSGTATFYKRDIELYFPSGSSSSDPSLRLGSSIPTPLPIRFAEIRILDGSSNLVQCGKTNALGELKALDGTSALKIPSSASAYTVEVLSRGNHAMDVSGTPSKPAFQLLASVKSPCNQTVHKVTSTVNASGGVATYNTSLVATANEATSSDIPGGAFNIYNNVVSIYSYLAQKTGTSDLSCLSPKLDLYWAAGFNPAQLIYPEEDPSNVSNISFYLRGMNELYINGGKLGSVANADTDHFDDAVIVHEVGHRIEDACGKMESPGGPHFGLFRIDPRLAWSEGFGNFLGAHIIRNEIANINPNITTTLGAPHDGWLYYLDTYGYHDGFVNSGQKLIQLNLSKPANNPEMNGPYYYDKVDPVLHPGEGHFREVSVARSLFKTTNTCAAAGCTDTDYFAQMWKAFEKHASGIGMGKSIYPFRSSVRFFSRLKQVFTNAAVNFAPVENILNTDEAQQIDGNADYVVGGHTVWVPFGIKLAKSGVSTPAASPCSLKILPKQEFLTTTYVEHDQRYSSHFYYLDRTAGANPTNLNSVTSVTLTLTKNAGTDMDIDLLLFQEGYQYPADCSNYDNDGNCTNYIKVSSSQFIRSDRSIGAGATYTKTISDLDSLNASIPYLLNIKAYTAGKTVSNSTDYTYTLKTQTGEYLCPSATF
jgi:hypothetical protein